MRARRFAPIVIAALACGPAYAEGEARILPRDFAKEGSLESATIRAAKEGKAVVLYYTRTQCPPCEILQWRLRKEDVAANYRESYVFTAVWGTSMNYTERQHYRSTYNVGGAPTWIFFTSDGQYLCTSSGGFSTDEHGARLHAAVQARLKQPSQKVSTGPRACM